MHFFVTGVILIMAAATIADRCTEEFERGIKFTAQPENVMVCAHDTAIFSCNYTGSTFPLWLINSTSYLSSGLPENIMYNGRTRQLIVSNVTDDQNNVTFQCYFHIVNKTCNYFITSAVGTLLITSPDSCLCQEDLFLGCQGTTMPEEEDMVTPTESVSIEMDTPSHDQSVKIIALATSLGLASLIILVMIILALCYKLQLHRKIKNNYNLYNVKYTRSRNNSIWNKIGSIFERQRLPEESETLLTINDSDSSSDDYLEDAHTHKRILNNEDVRYLDPQKMAICEVITTVFKRHGAVTLKTPLFESTAKEKNSALYDLEESCLYHIRTNEETFLLRYDLTVPFARYLARTKCNRMKRYQFDTIYRDGRGKHLFGPQLESYHCDFDIAGEFDPMVPDAECLKIVNEILSELKFDMKRISIKVSHYKILEKLFVKECDCSVDEFKQICTKVVRDPNHDWLGACKTINPTAKSPFLKDQLTRCVNLNDLRKSKLMSFANEEVEELETLLQYCRALGINEEISLDLSLPLYFNYYTGLIFEARFQSGYTHKEVMLAAGGRYDEVVEKIRPGCHIPCVGLSVLIERIFKHMNEREHLNLESVRKMQTKVLVASDQGRLKERMELCAGLWEANIQAEFAYRESPNLDEQLQYCNENDIPFCVIVKNGERQIRDMKKGCKEVQCFTSNDDVITKLTKEIRESKEMSPFMSKPATSTYT